MLLFVRKSNDHRSFDLPAIISRNEPGRIRRLWSGLQTGTRRRIHQDSSTLIICTGQRSAASVTQASRSDGEEPSPMFPADRNFSIIWLNESSGFSSKNSGHVSQQVLQLVQFGRSMLTFMMIHLISAAVKYVPPKVLYVLFVHFRENIPRKP